MIESAIQEGSDATDRALMERVCTGDEVAFGWLMQRWERPVKALLARLVLNASEAEDLAQETFVRVWQHREKFRAGAEFRPWLFTIAANLARNRLAWWRRRPAVELAQWDETKEMVAVPRPARGGGVTMEQQERGAAVRAAIADLPPRLREVLVLFEYEELSYAEIAAMIGASPKTVETRIYRAKEKLRGSLRAWA